MITKSNQSLGRKEIVHNIKSVVGFSSKNIDKSGQVSFEKLKPGKSHGIYHGLLYIDPKVCVRCGECEKACPTGAIKLSKVSKINAPA